MAKRRKLATLFVDFVADKTGLKRDMSESRREVERASQSMESSANKVNESFGRVGNKIDKSTAGIRKLVEAAGSVVGVFGTVAGIITTIATAIVGLIALIRKLSEESKEARDNAKAAANARAEFFQSELQAADSYEKALDRFSGASKTSRQEAEDSIRAIYQAQVEHVNSLTQAEDETKRIGFFQANDRIVEAAKNRDKALEELDRRARNKRDFERTREQNELLQRVIDEEKKVADQRVVLREEAEKKIARFRFEAEKSGLLERDPEAVQRFREAVEKQLQAELDAINKAADAKEKAEMEAEKRLHEQRLDNIRRETEARRKAIQEIEQATASSIDALTGRFNNQAHVFKQIDESLRRIADQGVGEAAF